MVGRDEALADWVSLLIVSEQGCQLFAIVRLPELNSVEDQRPGAPTYPRNRSLLKDSAGPFLVCAVARGFLASERKMLEQILGPVTFRRSYSPWHHFCGPAALPFFY